MQIVMPMAGTGERFKSKGFKEIKPLIPVGEKTMVEHACSIFPTELKFYFLCNSEHLETTNLENVLKTACPNSEVIASPNKEGGPVETVLKSKEKIPDSEETIVSYCDFSVDWNYSKFTEFIHSNNADGAIPVFRGFQPAQFTGTRYAYVRTKDDMRALEIREKESFTSDKDSEFASAGIYYFKSGQLMKKYLQRAKEDGLMVNNELYASLPFNPMINDGLRVFVYEVEKFLCFGTPNDVKMYNFWHEYLRGGGK